MSSSTPVNSNSIACAELAALDEVLMPPGCCGMVRLITQAVYRESTCCTYASAVAYPTLLAGLQDFPAYRPWGSPACKCRPGYSAQPVQRKTFGFAEACAEFWKPFNRNREADKIYLSKKYQQVRQSLVAIALNHTSTSDPRKFDVLIGNLLH